MDRVELETTDLGMLDLLDPFFEGSAIHLTGGPGAGKSLLLLYYLGHRVMQRAEGVLWVDAGNSFPAIARQLRQAEFNPPSWVRQENARIDTLGRRPALPHASVTPVIDAFLEDPAPAPQDLHPIPAPAPEIIPLCRLCGGLVKGGICERCGAKVCPACKAANYATETFCRKCYTPL